MTIRVLFRCTCCGSSSFRPSSLRTFKDTVLKKFGLAPQRCLVCRRRFYLYRPATLQSILTALAGSPWQAKETAVPLRAKIPMAHARRKMELGRLADADSETSRKDLAG